LSFRREWHERERERERERETFRVKPMAMGFHGMRACVRVEMSASPIVAKLMVEWWQ
jgi:hypothetical protein